MPEIAQTTKVVHDAALGFDREVTAGQPVPPDLLDAYHEAGGETETTDAAAEPRVRVDPDTPTVVATQDVVVHDEALGFDRQIMAGQPVPADLLDAYQAETGESVPASPGGAPDYDAMSVDELQAEADRRGLTVEGTGKDGNVLKGDLVKALRA